MSNVGDEVNRRLLDNMPMLKTVIEFEMRTTEKIKLLEAGLCDIRGSIQELSEKMNAFANAYEKAKKKEGKKNG